MLLITTDATFADTIHHLLKPNGYHLSRAATVRDALSIAQQSPIKLALIDRRQQVIQLLRREEAVRDIPMIAIQPQGQPWTEEDMLEQLAAGFDMVLTSQRSREWLASIKAVLRRQEFQETPSREFRVNQLYMNLDRHEVKVEERPVQLTPKEFKILRVFLERPGRVLSRQALLDQVWGEDYALEEHALDVHIHALRQKLESTASSPRVIVTVRGVGYKLCST